MPRHFPLAALSLVALLVPGLSGQSAKADPIEIIDHEGRLVTLAAPAGRVASIPIPMASTIISMDGGTTRLVGMNPTAKSAILEGILGRIFPEARDIPSDITAPNFIPNVEELAATNPDVVIQWADRGADYVDPITNAGLDVILISYGTEEKTRAYQAMVASAIGKPERAAENAAWRDRVMADIAAKAANIPAEARPKILYLLRAQDALTASGRAGNYNSWYIELVGGVSASTEVAGNGVTISPEQIASWDPDIILLNGFEANLGLERITADPILSLTAAARTGRVYKMPLGGYRWDPPNQESPLTWMWLANLTHPDVFSYDLRAEMKTAYRTLYGHDLAEAEIDEILRMDMQSAQTGYGVFAAR